MKFRIRQCRMAVFRQRSPISRTNRESASSHASAFSPPTHEWYSRKVNGFMRMVSPRPRRRSIADSKKKCIITLSWSLVVLPQPIGHFHRPCAGVLFAHVRAVDEKDIRLFSASGKRWQSRREREKCCRDAAANLPRWVLMLLPFHLTHCLEFGTTYDDRQGTFRAAQTSHRVRMHPCMRNQVHR